MRRPNPATAGFGLSVLLQRRLTEFDHYFARALPAARTQPGALHEAIRYSALSPGKRFRPLLVLATCEAVGGDWRRALPAAAAVECVHAFSLVHDDLPSMDDDDFRRGRPTTHKVFGEAVGLLAGDALLAAAFEELARLAEHGVPAPRVVEAFRTLAHAAGSRELVGGQVLDLEAEHRPATALDVREIHLRKTGALLAACMFLGALCGDASAPTRARLQRMGRELGLAFQIHDDLMNLGSSLRRIGKRTGTDAARGKATYPRVVGEAQARAEAERIFARSLAYVRGLKGSPQPLESLILAVAHRQR